MSLLADNPTWTIAARIKRARLLAGIDQDEVAEACGTVEMCTPSDLNREPTDSGLNADFWAIVERIEVEA